MVVRSEAKDTRPLRKLARNFMNHKKPQVVIICEFEPAYLPGIKHVINTVMSQLRPDYNPSDPRNAELDRIPDVYGGKGKFWVAKDGEKIIGTVAVLEKTPREANIKKLFLLAQYRGIGIGKRLLELALDHCRKKSFQEVTLITSTYAVQAQGLYEHLGFRITDKKFDFDKTLIQYQLYL